MTARSGLMRLLAATLALITAACSASTPSASTADDVVLTASLREVTPATHQAAPPGSLTGVTIDAIFSGPSDDGDFNSLGAAALSAAAGLGASARYVPSVPVPVAERTLRALAADGPTIIWAHGSQFYAAASAVAADFPDVTFIGEAYGRPPTQPDNMWVMDAQFYLGFYALGAMAAELTETGVIGYVSGVRLPLSFSEVHAVTQAVADAGSTATVRAVWTSDFNDADKAEALTTSLIDGGADVILGALNDGAVGMFRAAGDARAQGRTVWVTAKYTDKSGLDTAGVYAGTLRSDFTGPLVEVIGQILDSVRTGYRPFEFNGGVELVASPLLPQPARDAMHRAMTDIANGTVSVVFDNSTVTE